ncbi:MAG: hypothetical protein HRT35_29940, partial [Algicola sp.]|nr:hypothetical protein [Algicola sp.]
MNKIKLISQLLAISTLCIGITACGGGGGGGGGDSTTTPTPTPTPTVNNPPTVSAGSSQSIDEQTLVSLTANASDSDGSIAAYQWTQTAGNTVTLSGSDSANATFTAPTVLAQDGPQSFTFQAQATDDDGDSATDTVEITVNPVNSAPVVDAGSTQIVNEGSLVQLTGTATDNDGSLDSILWTQTAGESVMLTDNTSLTPRFTTPNNEASATFSFALTVTDNEGESVQSEVDIEVRPIITGLVVDDVLSNATVQLLNVADQSLILETQTDENGRYVLAQQQSLPPRYVLSITGGTLNGQPFVGTLNSICLTAERLSCHATPLSTLIKRYADQQGTLETGDKTLWVETLSAALGFDLAAEPFINEDESIVPLSTIREFLQNGAQLEQWLATTLDYVENDTPSEDVESWFPTANLAPAVSAGDDQT